MHVVQSPMWAKFKTKMGTKSVIVSGSENKNTIIYTKHAIPLTGKFIAYCPKVDPKNIDWKLIESSLIQENCIAINFDVPNVESTKPQDQKVLHAIKTFQEKCVKSPKDTFAKANIILDISRSEEEILSSMHKKHRYNINYAQKQGVTVREGTTEKDFEIFFELLKKTADRQHYFIHPKNYYKILWETLGKKQSNEEPMAHILIAEIEEKPLTAWMLFVYENVLYYPYGGSSEEHKNLQHSLAVAWETIKLGKKLGCTSFDMWGASENPDDTTDPWYGFTEFKLKFGGKYVRYIDSYDFVINKPLYYAFNLANKIRWQILKLIK